MIQIEELYKLYQKCSGISTDSRKITEGTMFFALKGANFDGNDFALSALEAGARYAIVDRSTLDGVSVKGRRFCIVVENALTMLQQLASYHRSRFDIPLIGITGTNGKTTTKELVSAVLSRRYNTVSTRGNLNNSIGVPLTLLGIGERTQMCVVEMGASAPGDIAELVNVAHPTCGIVTNVGKAHLQGFGSIEGVTKTKGEMYDYLRQNGGTVFYNADNSNLKEMVARRNGLIARKYGVSFQNVEILPVSADQPYLSMKLSDGVIVNTHLVGSYNADNVMAALSVASYYDVKRSDAIKAIENYIPSNYRSQMVVTGHNTLIVDTYNANPTSMYASLDNFRNSKFEGKTLILGDMLELGEDSVKEHMDILNLACTISSEIYLVGYNFSEAVKMSLPDPDFVHSFGSMDTLKDYLASRPLEGRIILIKGSNGMHLEKIIEVL